MKEVEKDYSAARIKASAIPLSGPAELCRTEARRRASGGGAAESCQPPTRPAARRMRTEVLMGVGRLSNSPQKLKGKGRFPNMAFD